MKKLIALILVLALSFNMMPTFALAANKDDYEVFEICRDGAPARTKASEKGAVIEKLDSGDIIHTTGHTINFAGNLWYSLADGGWIYAGNVRPHSHQLTAADGMVSYCRCGYYEVHETGTQGTYGGLALPRNYLEEDVVAALLAAAASIKAAAATVITAEMLVAGAVVLTAAVVIGGIPYLAYVHCTATTVTLYELVREDLSKDFDACKKGSYYLAGHSKATGVLVAKSFPLTAVEALAFVTLVLEKSPVVASPTTFHLRDIYTPSLNEAMTLATSFCAINRNYFVDVSDVYAPKEFSHVHIASRLDNNSLARVNHHNMHFFYGSVNNFATA